MTAHSVTLMGFDVDGVLTDGTVYYGIHGDALKGFSILDGVGLKLLQKAGIRIAIITGRQSAMVEHRFTELGADFIVQAREDKGTALTELAEQAEQPLTSVGYMGDDFPDLSAARVAGFFASVPNAPPEVQQAAHYVARAAGGRGAVREVCEHLLKCRGIDPLRLYMESSR